MISLEEIDNTIKALRDMINIYETDELKLYLCDALELRTLILLNKNMEANNNDILN